jgi:four helix bundle protein
MKQDLSERFLEFAVSIIKLGKKLNKTYEGRHVYGQLFRAGTSVGANYEESQSAESKKDFQHKLQVVLKELKESLYWLRLIEKAEFVDKSDAILVFLLKENRELNEVISRTPLKTNNFVSN